MSIFKHIKISEVPAITLVIEPVTYNKISGYTESNIIKIDFLTLIVRFNQHCCHKYLTGSEAFNLLNNTHNGIASINDIFNDYNGFVFQHLIYTNQSFNCSGASSPMIGS